MLRSKKMYSQRKVADDLGITRSRYSKYEYGDAEPPIEILLKLKDYYDVKIDDLLLKQLV